jgi:predicted TIM-barrel fold metal-dependent hydrolase
MKGLKMISEIPIIDTHVHLWDLKHPELKWDWLEKNAIHPILGNIDGIKSVGFTIHDLWSEARFSNIEGFVHIQAAIGSPNPITETLWLTDMARSAPVPMRIIGDCKLSQEDAIEILHAHRQSSLFVGVRDFDAEPMLAARKILPQYERSLSYMAEQNLVFDLDCEWQNMEAAKNLALRHSDLRIVLEHIGFPRHRDEAYFSNWSKAVSELATAPNVTMKISGLGMTDPNFSKESLRRWVDHCLESFGADRCVLGSNWPVDRLFSPYNVIISYMRDYIRSLSQSEQEVICNRNARRIYGF